MGYKLCPKCELNYIKEDEEQCEICATGGKNNTDNAFVRPNIKHKGCNIFMVFKGKEYQKELINGYIKAPYKDARGGSPSHWTMLELVEPGDIIFHGLLQGISAISVATSECFSHKPKDEEREFRRVNCTPFLIKNPIITSEFLEEIKRTCVRYKYQPFDKNGDGRQGYLFDLNDELAGIFSRALIERNSDLLTKIPELKKIILY